MCYLSQWIEVSDLVLVVRWEGVTSRRMGSVPGRSLRELWDGAYAEMLQALPLQVLQEMQPLAPDLQ